MKNALTASAIGLLAISLLGPLAGPRPSVEPAIHDLRLAGRSENDEVHAPRAPTRLSPELELRAPVSERSMA